MSTKIKRGTERVARLLDLNPNLGRNYDRRAELAVILAYWQIYDGVSIPADTLKSILDNGTPVESILRYRRWARNLIHED